MQQRDVNLIEGDQVETDDAFAVECSDAEPRERRSLTAPGAILPMFSIS